MALETDDDRVWLIRVAANENSTEFNISGGGVCVDPIGIILASSRNINTNKYLQVRQQKTDFRPAKLLKNWPNFGFLLLSIENPGSEHYSYVDMTKFKSISLREKVYTIQHHSNLFFSFGVGINSYQFDNPPFPEPSDESSISSTKKVRKNFVSIEDEFLKSMRYRTSYSCFDTFSDWKELHPNLPFIQIQGMGSFEYYSFDNQKSRGKLLKWCPLSGSFGCPVYKERDGEFIGITTCSQAGYLFVVPSNFIARVVGPAIQERKKNFKRKELDDIQPSEDDDQSKNLQKKCRKYGDGEGTDNEQGKGRLQGSIS